MTKKTAQPPLTPEQEAFKDEVSKAEAAVEAAEGTYRRLLERCPHLLAKRWDSAICMMCDRDLGWWCDASPTKHCEYDDEADYLHDNCIHCGDPEERK